MQRATTLRRGYSLPELLVVLAILGLAVVVAVPLVGKQVRLVQIHSAAEQFASNLRAARMVAVSTRDEVIVQVDADPTNAYSFPDARGRTRLVRLPEGIRIVSSPSPIRFRSDGSIADRAITILESVASDGTVERWTVTTGILGIARTDHVRLPPGGGAGT